MVMLTCYTELDSVMDDEFEDSNMNISEIEDGEKNYISNNWYTDNNKNISFSPLKKRCVRKDGS